MNCRPPQGSDPVGGTFSVEYDNGTGTAARQDEVHEHQATLTKGANTLDWTFLATPDGLAAATWVRGAKLTVTHTKTAGSSSGTSSGTPCRSVAARWP
ncbi:MAG: hypothetical protein U0263_22220 [Polyangiaceae bacterium]